MNTLCERSEPSVAAIDQPHPNLTGTWTIDPAASSASFTWRNLRLWTMTGRLHCVGVVHLDAPPPVGAVQFEQPSGLPVLTMALDPASVETHDADLDSRLRSPEVFDVLRHRWWLLRSESLEILPSGAWRVMATLTANGTAGAIELRLEVDPAASSPTWLVLRGRGLLDRRALGIGRPASTCSRQIRLDLAVRARRVGAHLHLTNRPAEVAAQVPMHRVTARTDPQPPDAGMLSLSPSTPPIGRYRRVPVQVHQADPDAPEVARRLIALIATRWPATGRARGQHGGARPGRQGNHRPAPGRPPGPHPGHHPGPARARLPTSESGGVPAHPAHAVGHVPPRGHRVPGPRARGPGLQPGGRGHAGLAGRLAGRPGPASPLRGPEAGDRGWWAG
jgi:polyisoprenoid-binding protein YceI